jgi:hypothetical protein
LVLKTDTEVFKEEKHHFAFRDSKLGPLNPYPLDKNDHATLERNPTADDSDLLERGTVSFGDYFATFQNI